MNVYNFLNWFDKRTDVVVHDVFIKDQSKNLYMGKVEDLTTSEALTWRVVTTMLVCNTLFVYVEVEE
jgi:hypothetical protein